MGVFFSIIVPTYNVSQYLRSCLESINESIIKLDNSVKCECLVIDDGSTDNSSSIAKIYAENNDAFHYYRKENGGLSDARNFGLDRAIGEYIVFVDSDDEISCQLLKTLHDIISNNDADLVIYDFIKFSETNVSFPNKKCIHKSISNSQLAKYSNFAWARVTRREYYDDNKFPVGYIYEDVVTTPVINAICKKPYAVLLPLYGYRKRPGSITTQSAIKQFDFFHTLEVLKARIIEKKIPHVFYVTAFVNLSKSAIVSLSRIDNSNNRQEMIKLTHKKFGEIPVGVGISSYSLPNLKFMFFIIKFGFLLSLTISVIRKFLSRFDKWKF
ncbi:glycosyltransferase family 2 protein [Serratia fonticola]